MTASYFNTSGKCPVYIKVLLLLPFLFVIPAFLYSVSTPFALVDDYGMWHFVEYLDSYHRFSAWFDKQVINFSYGRYRPSFDLYNMVTWKLLGAQAWAHHLVRWLIHLASVAFFCHAFVVVKNKPDGIDPLNLSPKPVCGAYLPLLFLIYVWVFFPNAPVMRLGPQELNTVFFAALCTWACAIMIAQDRKAPSWPIDALTQLAFCLGFIGLSISKEINIAVMLWMLCFMVVYSIIRFSLVRLIGALILSMTFLFTLEKIYTAATNSFYGTAPITPELIEKNAIWLVQELLQTNTSPVITTGFLILLTGSAILAIAPILGRNMSSETIFLLFLWGQLISFFMILCTSWAPVLRYWYVLIPLIATLMAFSVRWLLENTRSRLRTVPVNLGLFGFLLFFIFANYYNFMWQAIAQHSIRHAESRLITEIKQLHDTSGYVSILQRKDDPEAELVAHLISYFRHFLPRYHGEKIKIHTQPPAEKGRTYYLVTMHPTSDENTLYKVIEPDTNYATLEGAEKISAFLQNKKPYLAKDAGVHYFYQYRWYIYSLKN
jgi:hypothetical protein